MTGKKFDHLPIVGHPTYWNSDTGEYKEHPSPEDIASVDIVLCMLDEEQSDTVPGLVHEPCNDCGRMLHHAPNVPAGLRMCIYCAVAARRRELAD